MNSNFPIGGEMNIISRFFSIGLSISLLILIFELVRRKRLKEKYALLWIIIGLTILLFALFENLLNWTTYIFGIQFPINAMLFLGIFFILLMNLHFSITISNLTEQNKKIAQKLALLEIELKNLFRKL